MGNAIEVVPHQSPSGEQMKNCDQNCDTPNSQLFVQSAHGDPHRSLAGKSKGEKKNTAKRDFHVEIPFNDSHFVFVAIDIARICGERKGDTQGSLNEHRILVPCDWR
jgi:hypothetical protein